MANDDLFSFCIGQTDRLGLFREWGFMNPTAKAEFAKFLCRFVARDKIARIVDEALMLPQMPTLAALVEIRDRLYPPLPAATGPLASLDCPDCAGTGWMRVMVGAYDGVAKCRCGGHPHAWSPEGAPVIATSDERAERSRTLAETAALLDKAKKAGRL
jgi:hypothetical protein